MAGSHYNPSEKVVKATLELVQELDLRRITRKVQNKLGWDTARADQAEMQYRQYLALIILYPDRQIAPPSQDADEIWHGHVLDTQAYQQDCDNLFGDFLHHVPSYGGPEEKLLMAAAREQSEALFEKHFGQDVQQQETAFCICMAGHEATAKEQAASQEAGCVPCFGQQPKKQAADQEAGCVPCLGHHAKNKEDATVGARR